MLRIALPVGLHQKK